MGTKQGHIIQKENLGCLKILCHVSNTRLCKYDESLLLIIML